MGAPGNFLSQEYANGPVAADFAKEGINYILSDLPISSLSSYLVFQNREYHVYKMK